VFSFLLISICSFGNPLTTASSEEITCNAPSAAWVENLTPTSFDLYWNTVAEAINYDVEVFVNGASVFMATTSATSIPVTLPLPLQAGDQIQYYIFARCLGGGYSEPLIGSFSIIATEDVVMTSPNGNGTLCNTCPLTSFPLQHSNNLFLIYDCACVSQYQGNWRGNVFCLKHR